MADQVQYQLPISDPIAASQLQDLPDYKSYVRTLMGGRPIRADANLGTKIGNQPGPAMNVVAQAVEKLVSRLGIEPRTP